MYWPEERDIDKTFSDRALEAIWASIMREDTSADLNTVAQVVCNLIKELAVKCLLSVPLADREICRREIKDIFATYEVDPPSISMNDASPAPCSAATSTPIAIVAERTMATLDRKIAALKHGNGTDLN